LASEKKRNILIKTGHLDFFFQGSIRHVYREQTATTRETLIQQLLW